MNDELYEQLFLLHLIFGILHLVYFMIYYGRYSKFNQQLNGVVKMEKAGVVDQTIIDASKVSISARITKWRKWSYFPIPFIAIVHLIVLSKILPENIQAPILINHRIFYDEVIIDYSFQYWIVVFILLGSLVIVTLGNYTKGAQIFDPNKRFRGTTGRRW